MRIKLPENISRLVDVFAPCVHYDMAERRMKMQEDAPDEAIQAKTEYDEWAANHKPHMEGYGG